MTVNQIIMGALKPLGIPIVPDFYGDGETEYITFNYADDRAEVFGDDAPLNDIAYMQIHYFLPADKDYLANRKEIRRALHENGFTYPEVTEMIEPYNKKSDNKIRHIIFECEIENEYEMEE